MAVIPVIFTVPEPPAIISVVVVALSRKPVLTRVLRDSPQIEIELADVVICDEEKKLTPDTKLPLAFV